MHGHWSAPTRCRAQSTPEMSSMVAAALRRLETACRPWSIRTSGARGRRARCGFGAEWAREKGPRVAARAERSSRRAAGRVARRRTERLRGVHFGGQPSSTQTDRSDWARRKRPSATEALCLVASAAPATRGSTERGAEGVDVDHEHLTSAGSRCSARPVRRTMPSQQTPV